MSHTAVPTEYARGDHAAPTAASSAAVASPGKVAIWMFLASEVMFFIGILGTYLILRSGAPDLFFKHSEQLSKPLAGVNTIVLIVSSLTMALGVDAAVRGNRSRTVIFLALTLLCSVGFLGIKAVEYHAKFIHYTAVWIDTATRQQYVFDGHTHASMLDVLAGNPMGYHGEGLPQYLELEGYRAPALPGININLISAADVRASEGAEHSPAGQPWRIPLAEATVINLGPWKNIFYSCYFALTGVHGLHVVGGMIAIGFLLINALRGKLFPAETEHTGLYWHFVDLVWIFLFPLLYLI